MTNHIVLETLHERRQEMGEEQQRASTLVAQCQKVLAQSRAAVETTQEQAEGAAEEDERTQVKYLALLEYLNDLIEVPQVLLEKITTLQAELVKTAGTRRHTADLFQQRWCSRYDVNGSQVIDSPEL